MQEFTCAKVGDTEWAAARVAQATLSFLAVERHQMERRGLPEHLRRRIGGPAPVAPVLLQGGPVLVNAPATAVCTSEAILAALPAGATMEKFTCADVSGKLWAAARVSPGDTVFFLQWNGTKWNAQDSHSICGTASAGLPQSLLSYCKAAPSSSPTTPATAACTSEAILAALPAGATMQEFTCADVSGKLWAAARVSPGDTVFFLQWNGTKWNAEDSDSICGTASAGLPQSLLSYCK